MAPVNATPLSQRTLSPFDDTPTRAPSSGHSSLNPLTSLKPQRTRSLSSFATALRPNNSTSLLADPIEADNTELHRRRVEASFQRQLDSLANANRHLEGSSASSDHDDAPPRRRFNDESASSSSSASSHRSGSHSSDALSLGSLRIGLTGSAPVPATASSRTARGVTIEDVEDGADSDSDGHLTYVTERASVLDSPARPLAPPGAAAARSSPAPKQQQQQPARAAAAAPSGGLFGSPRPSVLSHMHATATSSPRRTSAPPPRNENLPPSPAARPSPAYGAGATAAYPSVAPPRTVAPPASFSARSPFSPATGPRAGAPVGSAYKPKHYSPLNPALNSPLNASPAASTVRGAGSRVHSPTSLVLDDDDESDEDSDDEARRMADRTTRTALPDRTGLTDMLRSPKARRGEPAIATASARRPSPAGSGSGSGRSAEANLVSTALAGLTSKLATLERDNAQSAARVAELEARLAQQQQQRPVERERERAQERDGAAQEREEQARRLRREVETMLGDERDRRAELERVVQSLRAQNAHLDATLSAQHAALASLRTASVPASAPAAAAKGEYALRTEVQDLKHALAALGYEVDGVRTVVEELLRDKEARDAGRRWDAEEAERRAALDELSVEGGGGRGQDEGSRSSFVAPSEVERLVREQEEEARRRRRASTGAQRPTVAAKHRTAPPPAAKYDSTYVPSLSDSAGSRSSASLVSATSATSYATSASADDAFAARPDDEPDFARAQRIFDDVQAVSSPPRARRTQPARAAKAAATAKPDRVVLVDEPSTHLCTNCHGRKSALRAAAAGPQQRRGDDVDCGADADEEDLAFASGEAEARRARAAKKERRRAKEEAAAAAEVEAARAEEKRRAAIEKEERRRSRARDEHRSTLEGVLDRLEGDFSVQKKLYLELTAEYQSMSSRADTRKRRVLASHLKGSIDVLEDKAREVKRYADALEDQYETMHEQTCPRRRKTHATI
ncbi:hypothetical protein JCM9279_001572 [Rhodotorula babjevae]